MTLATPEDKKEAVQIITNTFDQNPSVNIVIGSGGNRRKKIGRLGNYAFIKAFNRNGAYLSSNRKGAALCFESEAKGTNFAEFWAEFPFAISIPPKKVIQTLKRESYIKKHRFEGKHLYFWFLGVEKDGGQAVFELKEHLFELSKQKQLPILLETSVERNRSVYERYGFEVYHTWKDSGGGKALWFMMRKPN
ncbi:hypothetical protein N9Y60_00080 [Crocinitomicaceae bacterium]|nr:hypothetical protein [Crocinitomicaceae bacterium]MDB3906604.1 hypothetical protein [Crocinitomicaceae bacterium]